MNIKLWGLLILLFMSAVSFAGYRDGNGEFPHGNVFLVNPQVDGTPTDVELKVDRSGFLKNTYVHVVNELEGDINAEEEISVKEVSVLQATVFYHAQKMYEFLLGNGFREFTSPLKIVLSYRESAPLSLYPEKNMIVFGKAGLKKHALDADIISSAVVGLFIMSAMEITSEERPGDDGEAIIYGISYYFACILSRRPVFASSVNMFNLSLLKPFKSGDNKNDRALSLASALWRIAHDSEIGNVNQLVAGAIRSLNKRSSINDFMFYLIEADFELFDGTHANLIFRVFKLVFE